MLLSIGSQEDTTTSCAGKLLPGESLFFCRSCAMLVFQVITVTLVAVAMAMSLAHALELPGKMRLNEQAYYAIQSIYYPGFTIGGCIGEVGGTISTAILLFLTPFGNADFWWTLVALLSLICMQAVYWLFTHPVNEFWVDDANLDRLSSGFFSFGAGKSQHKSGRTQEWTELRNRWEYSHVARAGFGLFSFVTLLVVIAR